MVKLVHSLGGQQSMQGGLNNLKRLNKMRISVLKQWKNVPIPLSWGAVGTSASCLVPSAGIFLPPGQTSCFWAHYQSPYADCWFLKTNNTGNSKSPRGTNSYFMGRNCGFRNRNFYFKNIFGWRKGQVWLEWSPVLSKETPRIKPSTYHAVDTRQAC